MADCTKRVRRSRHLSGSKCSGTKLALSWTLFFKVRTQHGGEENVGIGALEEGDDDEDVTEMLDDDVDGATAEEVEAEILESLRADCAPAIGPRLVIALYKMQFEVTVTAMHSSISLQVAMQD